MARVLLQGGTLVVRFNDGSSRSSGIGVNAGMSEADIQSAVARARSSVSAYYYGAGDDAHAHEAERAAGDASGIYRQLHPEARPAERHETPPPREQRRQREAQPPAARREERHEAPPARTRSSTPRPTVNLEWLETQLRETRRDDRRSQAAATAIYANRRFVDSFLTPEGQRGVARTDNQKNATIAVFNSLYQIPAFRLYLSSLAAMRRDPFPDEVQRLRLPPGSTMPMYPEYVALQAFLTEPGRPESLGEQASAEIIRSADTYIRHFLIIFAAPNQRNARFRQEIEQMNIGGDVVDFGWRMRNIHGAMTFQPSSGRGPSDADRAALARLYLGGPMDADTLVASMLFVRRWTQEHPERGRGRTQDQIPLWTAPQVVSPELEGMHPSQVANPPVHAPTATVPRVAIVGDSIMAGGRAGGTLQTMLRRQNPGAEVVTFAHSGDGLPPIRDQLRQHVFTAHPPFNTVVLQGGVNSITGGNMSAEEAERIFAQMIGEARQHGLRVIIMTVTPWEGTRTSSPTNQRRTADLNTWLRNQAHGSDVVVVDASSLGEGNPPRLRSQYDSGDHLHPNEPGRDQLAALIAQAAYGISATADQQRSALQDFASRNWTNLSDELYRHVSGGNPEAVITIMRNRPQGSSSVEEALHTLGREDVQRAFDRVFNDYMSQDSEFLSFCRGRREYQNIARTGVRLGPTTDAPGRRIVVRAMQDYLNHAAGSSGQEWYGRLRDDLRLLYRQVLGTNRDDIVSDATEDMRTLSALALYSWRKTHQSDPVGAWGPSLNLRVERQQQAVQPPPPPPPPERREEQPGQRRRVITP
jgi:lysophospholipase L1-like esterase